MSIVSSSLRNLVTFLQDHQVSFSNGLLILFTIGGEQIFSFNAFKCPCQQPDAYYYALIFMVVPALILLILGVAVSNLTWRLLHGCKSRSEKSKNGFCKSFGYLFIAVARAAVVPCAWLFVSLLDGSYFACMQAKEPCVKDSEEIKRLKAVSQNISWISLGGLIAISFLVISIVRCFDPVTYVQYKFLSSYQEAEQKLMDSLIQESTSKLAETNVKQFMQQPKLKKEDWDTISRIPDHRIQMTDKADESDHPKNLSATREGASTVFLTPLHKWAEMHKSELEQQKPENINPV